MRMQLYYTPRRHPTRLFGCLVRCSESLCESRNRDNTSTTTSNIVVLTFTSDIFVSIEVADGEDVTTLAAACTKDFLSIYCVLASEESVYTESFSLLEFSYHMRLFFMKKASGLYRKVTSCQPNCVIYSKSASEMLVDIDIAGSSFRRVRLLPAENHISRFIRT